MKPSIAIITLTWNQRDLTLDCLESLSHLDYSDYRVIVVDNGSIDGTAEAVRTQYPDTAVLVNSENLGFVEGNNVGIRQALADGADYILLLNNDTVVDPLFLRELVAVAESGPNIGIVSPKIYYYGESLRVWCAGASIDWRTGRTYRLQADEEDTHLEDEKPIDVDFVSGCALCIKRKVIEKVGLLDPRFFIYYEETDWCARVTKAGYRVVYVPTAKIWHKVSSAMKTSSPITAYYMNRNVLLFLRKNLPFWYAVPAIVWQLGYQLRTIISLSVRRKHAHRRAERNARVQAILDFVLGKYGKKSL